VLFLLQQNPIVIDVSEPAATPARDISIDVVISIFALAGLFLLAAAIGSLLVAGAIVLVKRWRDQASPGRHGGPPSHTQLRV
jgi:hypothetical protein